MGKHVNAEAEGDQDEAAVAAAGADDGAHHGAARHSAEAGEPLESEAAPAAAPVADASEPGQLGADSALE